MTLHDLTDQVFNDHIDGKQIDLVVIGPDVMEEFYKKPLPIDNDPTRKLTFMSHPVVLGSETEIVYKK